MGIEYRPAKKEEWGRFGDAISRGFGNHPPGDELSKAWWHSFFDICHSVGAFEEGQPVGTSGSFTASTTVPGGARLQAALVTIVTVAATHRRRGILTSMMSQLLEGAHERGEPIATLWASESIIYGRFGYGMAGQHFEAKIGSGDGEFAHTPEIKGSMRFVDREHIRKVGPDIWERTAAVSPGMPERNEVTWQEDHPLPEDPKKPEKRRFYAVYEEDSRPEGYIAYRAQGSDASNGLKNIRVDDLVATSVAGHAALWRFILDLDLVDQITFETMPLDDPLWWMLANPRKLERTPYDAIWLRLLNVEKALSARTFAGPLDTVFEVEDEFCPWVAGRYRLRADAEGNAACERTEDEAVIRLPAASLATCYFGAVKFADLARAGRVEELAPGALRRADRAFATERAPWCPLHY